MPTILNPSFNFSSLSIKDLLEARDLYHFHLINKANVVGTAIGLYLIRKSDPYPTGRAAAKKKTKSKAQGNDERTFANSEVRDYSWPCVLVLVNQWVDVAQFGSGAKELHPEEMVPKTLYLPDGRMVPVCVVKVDQGSPAPNRMPAWQWPAGLFGGGMPILVETQARRRMATAGCLVTDGHTVFALTGRHVCGATGEVVSTISAGQTTQIGVASIRHLTRLPFEDIYPEFPSKRTYVNLDVGLIELDDVNDWTSQVFGLGATGALADLNELNITQRLIDARVVASGAASGRLEGFIKAIFYRYKSVGGFDYVADFLIAPEAIDNESEEGAASPAQTQPGDSGAIWHLVVESETDPAGKTTDRIKRDVKPGDVKKSDELRPLAIEWGGQVFLEGTSQRRYAFALATSLTTVCRILDVELVSEHNTGVMPYWGQMGHYSIAAFACDAIPTPKLQTFMQANVDRISFTLAELSPKEIKARLKAARENDECVPLADVPDIIWKNHFSKVVGGRDDRWVGFRATGAEHPTHYADIDQPRESDDKTLCQLCMEDPANVSVAFWKQFYDDGGHTQQRDRGLLPFRIWQFFDSMVGFLNDREPDKFLCAAGVMSHYVGDACQPLHGSMYADGYSDQKVMVTHHRRETGEEYQTESHVGAGIHSTYETKMIDRYAEEIVTGIPGAIQWLAQHGDPVGDIHSGQDAAIEIVRLMNRSAEAIPPIDLVEAFLAAGGTTTVAVQDALWEDFGEATIRVMADGARVLAKIWDAAWAVGDGASLPAANLGPVDPDVLRSHYIDRNFVKSLDLDQIEAVLQ